jgi:type I restriction enzyme S subunit
MENFLQAVLVLRHRLVANVGESRALAALRDALLPKLISGELTIKEAKKISEENYVRSRKK